jgi:hypothetical protein
MKRTGAQAVCATQKSKSAALIVFEYCGSPMQQ